jgi:hypothetical protein
MPKSDEPKQYFATPKFKVSDGGPQGNVPYILLEVNKDDMPFLGGGWASFNLKKGTTYEQAEELVAKLTEHVKNFSVTIYYPASPTETVH